MRFSLAVAVLAAAALSCAPTAELPPASPPLEDGGTGDAPFPPIECTTADPRECDGDYLLTSDEGAAALDGCGSLNGSLRLVGAELSDLAPLACLREIDGDLVFGLDDVARDSEGFDITEHWYGPVSLTSAALAGLGALETVTGTLRIAAFGETNLREPDGTADDERAGVTTLAGLTSLVGIGVLEVEGGWPANPQPDTVRGPGIDIDDWSALDDVEVSGLRLIAPGRAGLSTLPALRVTAGANVLVESGALDSFEGPTWPTRLGTLEVHASAPSFVGLSAVTAMDALVIEAFALESLTGLESVTTLGDLAITSFATLADASGLGVVTLTGDLVLEPTGSLRAPEDLFQPDNGLRLEHVHGDVVASGSLRYLEALETVGGDLRLVPPDSGARPRHLDALARLTSVGGDLVLSGYVGPNLNGLGALTSVGGLLELRHNVGFVLIQTPAGLGEELRHLESLAGLSATLAVGGLSLVNNLVSDLGVFAPSGSLTRLEVFAELLTDLTGLEGVTIVEDLQIYQNTELTSLDGLDGLTSVQTLRLENNPKLPQCLADALATSLGYTAGTGNRERCTCSSEVVCEPPCVAQLVFGTASEVAASDVACAEDVYLTNYTGSTASVPALREAGAIIVLGAPNLTTLEFPALQTADSLYVGSVPSLTSVSLPAAERLNRLSIDCSDSSGDDAPLTFLSMPALTSMNTLIVTDCVELAQCTVDAAVGDLTLTEQTLVGNDETCTCDVNGDVEAGSCAP